MQTNTINLKHTFYIFILLFIVINSSYSQSKDQYTEAFSFFDTKYGNDPYLVSGRRYINEQRYSFGNPYFTIKATNIDKSLVDYQGSGVSPTENKFGYTIGRVSVNGIEYYPVKIKYDIYNQAVIIKVTSILGAVNEVMLVTEDIDEFWLGKNKFVKNTYTNYDGLFIECTSYNGISCIFQHSKSYSLKQVGGVGKMGYSAVLTKKHIKVENNFFRFRAKGSFLKRLPDNLKPLAKDYINNSKIDFTDGDIEYFEMMFDALSK